MEPSHFTFLLQLTISVLLLSQQIEIVTGNSQPVHHLSRYIVHTNEAYVKNSLFLPQDLIEQNCSSNTLIQEPKRMCVLHRFQRVMNGFAARMTPEHALALEKKEGVDSVREEMVYTTQTTHTPEFLGLHQNNELGGLWGSSFDVYGEGVIIGVLDTGITPNHPSFNDEGMPPPPAKWKGQCYESTSCNNKLIGVRDLVYESVASPGVDPNGHGTHTSSTAAGNFVKDASFFGQAKGTSAGIAPRAHLAMYKVCSQDKGCYESDIAAAIELAMIDGVDVISMSIGPNKIKPLYADLVVIASLAAAQQGIFVSFSAGNNGPKSETVSYAAPWILTVASSTIDRSFRAKVVLRNGDELDGEDGEELIQPKHFPNNSVLPLIFPGASRRENDEKCYPGSLKNNYDVKGKIVVCIGEGGEETVKNAGGAAMIVMVLSNSTQLPDNTLPGSRLSYYQSRRLVDYIVSTPKPIAKIIFQGTIIGVENAPTVAISSARGPSLESPGILKPDITGPGVNILAAWNSLEENSRFNIISGTSMSCPHLSGVAALLKQAHPDWSPAVIKSAMMTSAHVLNNNNKPIMDHQMLPASVFVIGAGHVNPQGANDPGLVYDIHPDDYISYLCGLNYTDKQVRMVVPNPQVKCHNGSTTTHLNYPTFMVDLFGSGSNKVVQSRTVTNVGEDNSTYNLIVEKNSEEVDIYVSPSVLVFQKMHQQLTYDVTFNLHSNAPPINNSTQYIEASLIWTDGKHTVRSRMSIQVPIKSIAVMNRICLLSILLLVLVESILLKCI